MTERKSLCVYTHSTNGKVFYVGQGRPHRPRDVASRTPRWHAYVEKHGKPEINVHTWTNDRAEAQRIEAELIAMHGPCCNVRAIDQRRLADNFEASPMFSLRLNPDERKALDKAAAAEDRPSAYVARRAILDWLKEKGFLK
jgi:hypothetical protein